MADTDKPVEHATESHHDVSVMRQVRRDRVEAAFGLSERAYLEALEALADAQTDDNAEIIAIALAERDAAEKGRH